MKETHKGLAITEDEFNYVVDDLIKTLDKYKVPEKEKQELLAILGPMKPDIVEVS
jgi:hemoglobin